MKALLQKKNIFSRVSTIIVFTSLIVLSILQYKWVVNSGEKTISDMVRSYSFSIFGSIAQEFSHFNLLQQPLRRNGETDTYQIRKILENIYLDFEENYDMKYISSYSYVSSSESNTIYSFFDGNWIQNSSILQLPVYSEINLRNQEFRDFTVLPDESDNTKIWVIRQIKDIKDIVVYIHFNIVDFFNEKVMTTVQKALEEYEISWSFSVPEDGIILDNKNYKLSPLIKIKKAILKRNVKTYLTLPYERFPFFRINT
ncbi:MAG: hypothetical protein PF518_02035, partial [Spirochaetaceae bacterium]|nr:hypothetical protein [Spirochaetaceae bacterium]